MTAQADTRRMAETGTGSGRSPSGTVGREAADAPKHPHQSGEKGNEPDRMAPVAQLIDHGGFPFADQRPDFASWCDWARYRARQYRFERGGDQ